jgi:hypothetical protein
MYFLFRSYRLSWFLVSCRRETLSRLAPQSSFGYGCYIGLGNAAYDDLCMVDDMSCRRLSCGLLPQDASDVCRL